MKRREKSPSNPRAKTSDGGTPAADRASEMEAFIREYEQLCPAGGPDVLYCLPKLLLKPLEGDGEPLIPAPARDLEGRFSAWCEQGGFAGLFHGRPVLPGPLATGDLSRRNKVRLENLRSGPRRTTPGDGNSVPQGPRYTAEPGELIHERLRAYAGWLVTNPGYLKDLKVVRDLAGGPGVFSGAFPVVDWQAEGEVDQSPFGKAYRDLCFRWCLQGLLTWEIPEPLGPMLPVSKGGVPEHLAEVGVTIFVPLTIKCPTASLKPAVLSGWRETASQQASREEGPLGHLREWIDAEMRGICRPFDYGGMFLVWFYWNVLQDRYGAGVKEWGLMKVYRAFGRFLEGPGSGMRSPPARRKRAFRQPSRGYVGEVKVRQLLHHAQNRLRLSAETSTSP